MFSDPQRNLEQLSVDPGMRVADLGSGAGHYTIPAAKMVGQTGKVIAVDIQQELLVKLKAEARHEHLDNIDIVWGDVDEPEGSKIVSQGVDRVIVANVLFQVDDPAAVVTEAFRIVRPGGLVLLIDWSDSFGGLGPQASRIISETQGQALFEKAGFTKVRDITAGDHHYGMVFKKER